MTKEALMEYCWSRSFRYNELLIIADAHSVRDVPTQMEYLKFYEKEDRAYYTNR